MLLKQHTLKLAVNAAAEEKSLVPRNERDWGKSMNKSGTAQCRPVIGVTDLNCFFEDDVS